MHRAFFQPWEGGGGRVTMAESETIGYYSERESEEAQNSSSARSGRFAERAESVFFQGSQGMVLVMLLEGMEWTRVCKV